MTPASKSKTRPLKPTALALAFVAILAAGYAASDTENERPVPWGGGPGYGPSIPTSDR